MKTLLYLIRRNLKVYFKDRGMFVYSMITPILLLILYIVFLGRIYRDSFTGNLPAGFTVDSSLVDATVGAQLFSSLLAVCCITVSFCANLIMVQDRVSGAINDFTVSPVDNGLITLGYYFATMISALLICLAATAVSFVYLAIVGWYMSVGDVFLVLLDVFLLVNFGTALSTLVCLPLKTSGQMSAVGTVISAGYGFICGAYMPLSEYPELLRNVAGFLPGTYGTSIIRNHAFRGVLAEMNDVGVPEAVTDGIRDSIDCNIYFFGHEVPLYVSYIVLTLSTLIIIAGVVALALVTQKKKNSEKIKRKKEIEDE